MIEGGMIELGKASLAASAGGGVVLAVGEVIGSPTDPTVMVYSLAAAAMAVLTLLVKDKLAPITAVSGKDLLDRIDKLARGVDDDRELSVTWRTEVGERLDAITEQLFGVETGIESLRANQELLADESAVASWRSDSNGQCVWASKAIQNMVGYTFENGFSGTNWSNIFHKDDVPHVALRWADAVRTKSAFAMKTRYQHADGTVFPVQLHATVMPDGSFRGVANKLEEKKQ